MYIPLSDALLVSIGVGDVSRRAHEVLEILRTGGERERGRERTSVERVNG